MVDSKEEFSELTPEEMLYKNIKKILALLISFSIIYIIYFFEKLSNYVPHTSQVFNYVDIQDSSMINLENPKVNPDSIKFIYNGSPTGTTLVRPLVLVLLVRTRTNSILKTFGWTRD